MEHILTALKFVGLLVSDLALSGFITYFIFKTFLDTDSTGTGGLAGTMFNVIIAYRLRLIIMGFMYGLLVLWGGVC